MLGNLERLLYNDVYGLSMAGTSGAATSGGEGEVLVLVRSQRNRDALEGFILDCRARNISPKTLKFYTDNLAFLLVFANMIGKGLLELSQVDIRRLLASTRVRPFDRGGISQASLNARIRTWKRFYNYLVDEELIEASPMRKIRQGHINEELPKVLKPQYINELIQSWHNDGYTDSRNRVIVTVLYDTMIRVGELCNIKSTDVDLTGGTIKVMGKGRRERYVPICAKTAKRVHSYIARVRRNIPGPWLFCYQDGGKMAPTIVYRNISRQGRRIGLRRCTPHMIRHSGATQYLVNGGHIGVLQRILGHSDIRTTQIYTHLTTKDVVDAHERFSPAANL